MKFGVWVCGRKIWEEFGGEKEYDKYIVYENIFWIKNEQR